MAIAIDLPKELENELTSEAAQLGLPLSAYALRLLATGVLIGDKPKTGAELVAYWQHEGLIGSRSEITDSQAHARQIRAQAELRSAQE